MATPSPACKYQDGAAAAVNISATSNVATPGNVLTIALQSTSGVQSWTLRCLSADVASFGVPVVTQTSGYSATFLLPNDYGNIKFSSEVTDGNNGYAQDFTISVGGLQTQTAQVHRARGVMASNVASLSAFVGVSGGSAQDGLTYAQGDYILLVGQSTASQNGLYVVGVVAAGTAPLTRAPDWATGAVLPPAAVVEVSEGTQWNNSTWKVTTTGAITVDTTSVALYPRFMFGRTAMSGGAGTASVWALAASGANGSKVAAVCSSTATAVKATTTAGAGNGTLTLACGAGTDTVDWAIINW